MKNKEKNLKKESLILGKLLKKLAPRVGAKIFLEPEWKIAGQIIFKDGRKSYFRYNTLDLNPVGASEIAEDKDYANFFHLDIGCPSGFARSYPAELVYESIFILTSPKNP